MPTIVEINKGRITIDCGEISLDFGTKDEQEMLKSSYLMGASIDESVQFDFFPSDEDLSNALGHYLAKRLGGTVVQESIPPEPEAFDPDEMTYFPTIY